METAAVAKTTAMTSDINSVSPWIFLIKRIRNIPIRSPRTRAPATSIKGITNILEKEIVPALPTNALARSSYAEAIIHIASSRATTGNNVSTTSPFALYCLITITVAVGAVAALIAPAQG